MSTSTIRNIDPIRQANDSERLALLWRAFEEAEQRIADLEAELDRARRARQAPQPAAPSAPAAAAAPMWARESAPTPAAHAPAAHAPAAHAAAAHAPIAPAPAPVGVPPALLAETRARLRESHEREQRLVAELQDARRAAEAEAQRYALATRVIQHEGERARTLAAERDAACAALHSARAQLTIRETEMLHLNEELTELVGEAHKAGMAVAQARMDAQRVRTSRPTYSAPARVYPVTPGVTGAIPGIQPWEVEGLRRAGVNMMDALLYADLSAVSAVGDIGIPRLSRLRGLVELIAVDGIGPEWAERLYRAGVRGVEEVAALEPAQLERTLLGSYESEGAADEAHAFLLRTLPGRAAAIVDAARRIVAAFPRG